MYVTYIDTLSIPTEDDEYNFQKGLRRTCYNGIYPFKIFPEKGLSRISFSPITIFYGGNGSGKTTLLNVIAERACLHRHSCFSGSPFFGEYVRRCKLSARSIPEKSQILTSDDVFDYLLDIRNLNSGIDVRREELFDEYLDRKYSSHTLKSMSELDEWKESLDAKRKTQSQFVRDRLIGNVDMHSNGESAMKYFVDHITENALYLLDEPENSLSIGFQMELAEYISASASHYGCQFIISTHSPVLLAMNNAIIYDLDSFPVRERRWTELDNVRAYYDFFMEHRGEFTD